jgi:hypothetical protein
MQSPGIELVHEGVEAVLLLQACLSLAGGLSGGGTMSHRNLVERLFPWIQWQGRILIRWEYHPQNCLGFVQLARLIVLFRRF